MHLRLREIRPSDTGYEFVVGTEAVLDKAFTGSSEDFCTALTRGVAARGWERAGSFHAEGDTVVHCLPVT